MKASALLLIAACAVGLYAYTTYRAETAPDRAWYAQRALEEARRCADQTLEKWERDLACRAQDKLNAQR